MSARGLVLDGSPSKAGLLASPAGGYFTGTVIPLDGGQSGCAS